ncbi:MAG: NAD(P) transhydrogenase subunit alpha [Acidobacteria bacterium RIFCSPLOWO2_12_FULL_67_14b]|nr:MAG: NAD(P) transhydrogenase subunit alpha [Acidobacteria bacterium RIFCSPLOWO2_12_FULL_67_14b]
MIVGVLRETFPGERRVALIPPLVPALITAGADLLLEAGAGTDAGFPDAEYAAKGARTAARPEVFSRADVILMIRAPGANPAAGAADTAALRAGQIVIGFSEPLTAHKTTQEIAARGASLFAMELMPRITRAQSMDALSSMAMVAGYKAVLLAATELPRMFPLMMTAAGTVAPARVFVIGAGVAGLQAIASSRRLGAKVEAYDVRPAVKEQVESLGAKFVELPLETAGAEDTGGYAKGQDEAFYRRQRELMARTVAASDVVITTASVPGRKAPVLIPADAVAGMAPGSVIIDLAAERGGNCELTKPDETVVSHGVRILGPTNLPSTVPYHASQLYAKNITTFLLHLIKDGAVRFDLDDEITRETLVAHGGLVVHARVRESMGLAPAAAAGRTS